MTGSDLEDQGRAVKTTKENENLKAFEKIEIRESDPLILLKTHYITQLTT